MKHLFKPQILVVTLLGLIIFSSCTKQDDITLTQSSSDFEILKQDLEKDLHYMKYKKAKAIIFEKLKHADIDLLSIIEQVQKK